MKLTKGCEEIAIKIIGNPSVSAMENMQYLEESEKHRKTSKGRLNGRTLYEGRD